MELHATITDFDFHPMVDVVPSRLDYWVRLDSGHEMQLTVEGSIKELSRIFQFKVVHESEWDFTGFKGRRCSITRYDDIDYRFRGFID